MIGKFEDVAETSPNRFAGSPLGKNLEGMDFDNIENIDDSSLDAYVSDVSAEGVVNETDNRKQSDVENDYYSTYDERIKQTPAEESDRGEWSGDRGESNYTPSDEEIQKILGKYDEKSITYKDGIPDFSEVAEATVEIKNMSEDRPENFRQCDEKCAEQWNKKERNGRTDWTARDVKEWRQANAYSWHERNDLKTCDLVPTQVNAYFGHLGGVSECKKRDVGNGGSDFDE